MKKTLVQIHEDVPADHYDKSIKLNILQRYWHTRRFSEIADMIIPIQGMVLDVGCHSGTFTSKILDQIKTKKIYGIDISPSAISLAKKRIPFGAFQVADATKLPFKSGTFEAVFCLEVLEHLDHPELVFDEIYRVLKKDGYAVILVPTESLLFKLIWFIWISIFPVWKHAHVQSFRGDSLEKMARRSGFKVKIIKKFHLNMLKAIFIQK